ncbi:MAG: hypothetical protein CSYNP_04152 [Syntrophus sp. SKADARSKE-3]|nr:hypothetical protein [Syntrophus sp. SKADARSKE-3]
MKRLAILICLAALSYAVPAAAEVKAGFVKNVSGQVFIKRQTTLMTARVNDKLQVNDTLITKADGTIGVILQDNSVLSLGPNSRVILSRFAFEPAEEKLSFVAKIKRGTLAYLTGLIAKLNSKGVSFETPTVVCGIRGTHFAIKVDAPDEEDAALAKNDETSSGKSFWDKVRGK